MYRFEYATMRRCFRIRLADLDELSIQISVESCRGGNGGGNGDLTSDRWRSGAGNKGGGAYGIRRGRRSANDILSSDLESI